MQSLSPLASNLREKIEDDRRMYCKIAKFQTDPYGTKILLLICSRGIKQNNTKKSGI